MQFHFRKKGTTLSERPNGVQVMTVAENITGGAALRTRKSAAVGTFITFEGIDGCGKSTQVSRLCEALARSGHDVVRTREPGGSPGAEEIRALLLNGSVERWSLATELLLFTAARRDHLEKVILPALERGATVVCDRFADTTRAYQGALGGDMPALVEHLHDAVIGLEPDLTILLDIKPDIALRRALARSPDGVETRMEGKGLEFQKRAREIYLEMARAQKRFLCLDADGSVDDVAYSVLEGVQGRLTVADPAVASPA